MRHTLAETYGQDCILVPIDVALVPVVLWELARLDLERNWEESDYERGYNAVAQLRIDMAAKCIERIVESNNKIYRLIDTALNGVEYEKVGEELDGTPIIEPEIPTVPVVPLTGIAEDIRVIRDALSEMDGEDVEEIVGLLGQLLVLLG